MLIKHKSNRQVQTYFKPKLIGKQIDKFFFFFFATSVATDKNVFCEKLGIVRSLSGISNSYVQYHQDWFIYVSIGEKTWQNI